MSHYIDFSLYNPLPNFEARYQLDPFLSASKLYLKCSRFHSCLWVFIIFSRMSCIYQNCSLKVSDPKVEFYIGIHWISLDNSALDSVFTYTIFNKGLFYLMLPSRRQLKWTSARSLHRSYGGQREK